MQRNKHSFTVESLISHVEGGNDSLAEQVIAMPLALGQDNTETIEQPRFVDNVANTVATKDVRDCYPSLVDIKTKKEPVDESPSSHQGIQSPLSLLYIATKLSIKLLDVE